MSTIAQQMAAYTDILMQYKPAQDKPVTEIAIFRLIEPQSPATLQYFESNIIAHTTPGQGIKQQAWGFSRSDPNTFVWMLDWEKIQQHWDFWQTPAFTPVIACINKLFVAGRPLVRHYDFKPMGMLQQHLQRVFVWNDEPSLTQEAPDPAVFAMLDRSERNSQDRKDAYAVDMNETTWRCVVFGYGNEEDAAKEDIIQHEDYEAHLVGLKFSQQRKAT